MPTVFGDTDRVQTPAPFRLLDLPPELLIPILNFATIIGTKSDPIKIDHAVKSKKSTAPSTKRQRAYRKAAIPLVQPAISRVCCALLEHILPIFYSENIFNFKENRHSIRAVCRWLEGIGPHHASKIQHLYMRLELPGKSCSCFLRQYLRQLANISGSPVTIRVAEGKAIYDLIMGTAAFQIFFTGVGAKRDDEIWVMRSELLKVARMCLLGPPSMFNWAVMR